VSDQYQLQAEQFNRIIRKKEKQVWGVDDAITNMKIIDALFKSGKSGRFEKIG
jgi:predicted dehydrogenase